MRVVRGAYPEVIRFGMAHVQGRQQFSRRRSVHWTARRNTTLHLLQSHHSIDPDFHHPASACRSTQQLQRTGVPARLLHPLRTDRGHDRRQRAAMFL